MTAKLPYESECDCSCHRNPGEMHCFPCCQPDPLTPSAAPMPGFTLTHEPFDPNTVQPWEKHEHDAYRQAYASIVAALAAHEPAVKVVAVVPEGWQLVPVELTDAMQAEINLTGTFARKAMQARYAAMLAAAPSPALTHPAPAHATWRGIETAPKDGTPILAFGPEPVKEPSFVTQETRWEFYGKGSIAHADFVAGKGPSGGWGWHEPFMNWGCKWEPTHWMPLPTRPTDAPAQTAGTGAATQVEAWEAWSGGEKPVGTFAKVQVKLRNGEVISTYAGDGRWNHKGNDKDVVAWRRHEWKEDEE